MSAPVRDDHFFRQFDRYESGPRREEAIARHAAMLLNQLTDAQAAHRATMMEVVDLLRTGTNPVEIALMLRERLSEFEED